MRETPKCTCDQCGGDISFTAYSTEYRAVISAEPRWHAGGAVYAMALPPPVQRNHEFCDMICLAVWVAEHQPQDLAEKYARRMKARDDPAENSANSPSAESASAGKDSA